MICCCARRLAVAFLLLGVLLGTPPLARAAIVTVPISGTLAVADYNFNISNTPIPRISVGDPFTGSFTFDDSLMPPQTSEFLPGLYSQTFPAGADLISATVTFNGLTFSTDPNQETSIGMRDNDT